MIFCETVIKEQSSDQIHPFVTPARVEIVNLWMGWGGGGGNYFSIVLYILKIIMKKYIPSIIQIKK